nr:S9 family peptidase [Clostridia bacterium]
FSPEGGSAAFTLTRANLKKNGYDSWLWLRRDGKNSRLTGLGKEHDFVWLDEKTIAFAGDREQRGAVKGPSIETKYYKIRIDGGEAEEFLRFPVPVSKIIPMKGGDFIVCASVFPGWEDLYRGDPKRAEEYLKDKKENEDYEVIAQMPWWWNGGTYTKGSYSSVFRWDHRRKKLIPLLSFGIDASSVKLGKDESFVYFIGKDAMQPFRRMEGSSFLARVPADGKTPADPETLVRSKADLEIYNYELADSFLLLLASDQAFGRNTDPDFFKVDYETGERAPYAKWGQALGSSVASDVRYGGGLSRKMVGDTLYFATTLWDGAYLYKLEDGQITPVIEKDGSVDCFDIAGGKALLAGLYDMRPQELYEAPVDGPKMGTLKRVSDFCGKALRGRYVAQPEPIVFERLGRPIHGFVIKPLGFDPAKKYPCILDVHGGPKTVYGPVFFHEMQYWAGKGYFVIYCNPQGSDGRGGEFMDVRGKYGTVDYDDIMAFLDEALAAYPQIDPEELFETGGSYGGFMTNWIVGHTDRFRACASQRSISNWFSFYGVSDIGPEFSEAQQSSTPWREPAFLWSRSPMAYADKAKTPTLFIHSFEDYRCPIDQAYQMFSALLAHGVESKIVAFRGENHELSRSGKPQHRIRRLKEITAWFDGHRK